ncbi:hypothetical protein AGLY_003503 [Aphis glycines]|uniref:Uncharacterized protein n=1 Tax=Aphis glycines TaxID=307491 RepID=A0A6G0U2B5_APHGL|nr:hypothetical protein AGLY_003503 [Aphis glycines]
MSEKSLLKSCTYFFYLYFVIIAILHLTTGAGHTGQRLVVILLLLFLPISVLNFNLSIVTCEFVNCHQYVFAVICIHVDTMMPSFGLILAILATNEKRPFTICEIYQTIYFDEHFQAFNVIKTNNLVCISLEQLGSIYPTHAVNISAGLYNDNTADKIKTLIIVSLLLINSNTVEHYGITRHFTGYSTSRDFRVEMKRDTTPYNVWWKINKDG